MPVSRPRHGNFGVAASGSRRGRLGRPPGSAVDGGTEEVAMPDRVYRVTEVIGVSGESWEAAAQSAVQTAAMTCAWPRWCGRTS
jgi:hypothetical protein